MPYIPKNLPPRRIHRPDSPSSAYPFSQFSPRTFDDLQYHHDMSNRLISLANSVDFPHLLFYGPSGAGKKTRIACTLQLLFGSAAEKRDIVSDEFRASSKRTFEAFTIQSRYHYEITPATGNLDKVVLQDILNTIRDAQQFNWNTKHRFKVIVINEANTLSIEAQAALRRTMETHSTHVRLILCTESLSGIIEPLKSRCLFMRVAAPKDGETELVLQYVARRANFIIPSESMVRIIEHSEGNLRQAILTLEMLRMSKDGMEATPITLPDWKQCCNSIAYMILSDCSPQRVMAIRTKLYELLTHCISATVIFKTVADVVVGEVDESIRSTIVHWTALYELRAHVGKKEIYHLEAWVIKVMRIYHVCTIKKLPHLADSLHEKQFTYKQAK